MPEVKRHALVLHSPERMFELVADVPRYPEFLSWCDSAQIHRQTDTEQVASVSVRLAGVTGGFTTRNCLVPGHSLEMALDESRLFSDLRGRWTFLPLGAGCRVELSLAFEFNNRMAAAAFTKGFTRVADRLVSDFCARADAVYG